ncbi:LuxR C-terminal-related transcriptional regulator [Serratia marcescens]|uniref:LuxR C-terminal-related transcriptional regulator n=1 Tax=Serratia marcescens TaxID=615 RepID=UPI003F7F6B2E
MMSDKRYICAVRDVIPAYRRGLMDALKVASYEVAEPEDVLHWLEQFRAAQGVSDCCFTILHSIRADEDFVTLRRIQEFDPKVRTIALLLDNSGDLYARALNAGASGAVSYGANPTEIIKTLIAALEGAVLLPHAIVDEFLSHFTDKSPVVLDSQSLITLNKLAAGHSIAEISREENASERTMHRRMKALYRRLGVENRNEAIITAVKHGFIKKM